MRKYLIAAVLLLGGVPVYAQGPGAAGKAAVPAAVNQSTRTARGAQPAAAEKKAAAKPAPEKQADQDNEEAVVMIDSKSDSEDNGSFNSGEDREERAVPGGIPSSYGQCKGTINEGGRSLLVFESADDGTISFVQVVVAKTGVTWKLVDRIPRSAD